MTATPIGSNCSTGSPTASPSSTSTQQSVEWTTLDDGHEALLVNGGGIDGGAGAYFANAGDDVHAVGSLAPIIDGYIGCIVIKADGSRYVARAVPDPLAEGKPGAM